MSLPPPPDLNEVLALIEAVAEGTVTPLGPDGMPPFGIEHEGQMFVLADTYGFIASPNYMALRPDHPIPPSDDAA